MLTIVHTADQVAAAPGEIRAGGTDLMERIRLGVSSGPLVDIYQLEGLGKIRQEEDGRTRIGALATIDAVGQSGHIQSHYPGLASAANGLATPQIRWAASMGGALLQRSRCWFYRHPDYSCFKSGGEGCPARERHNPNGVVFDQGGCVYPHPSTLGMALLAYEAEVVIHGQGARPIAALYGDGSDATRDHLLAEGELLTEIRLPPPTAGEQTAYFRSISRFEAEWPIVECLVRLVVTDGVIQLARVGLGGVAAVPLRGTAVEATLEGAPATQATLEAAAAQAITGANPLPHTAHKLPFVVGTVLETLEQALEK